MALNISELARMGEFSLELQSPGTIRCLSLKTSHISQLQKKLVSSGIQSLDFVRWLLGEIARRPVEGRSDEDDAIEGSSLTEEELNSVTDEILEKFADKLIQKNRYLLKTHKGSDIDRSADESVCEFLVRAFRHYAAEEKVQWERMTKPVSNSLFTSATLEAMQRNLGLSDQLQDTIDKYTHGHSVAEQMLAEEKDKWARMSQSASQSLCSSDTAAAMQQLACGTIANANRYLTENTATAAMEKILKREQDLMRAIDPFKDINRHMEENLASIVSATQLTREQDLVRAATGQPPDAQHHLGEISASATLAKTIYHNEDMVREAALGLTLRGSMPAGTATGLKTQQQEILALLKKHEALFWLPQASEVTRLLASCQAGAVAGFSQHYAKDTLDRQHFLEAITTPWANNVEAERSITALLELQGMGNALRTTKGFDPELTAALRLDLGDWRDKITFPDSVIIDPVSRTDFYVARGFDVALTDFPDAAFYRGLHIAGLDGEALDFELIEDVDRLSTEQEEAGLRRTNKCHNRLQRFERQFRQFINSAMTAQYGSDWPRKRLAPKLYEYWVSKKQKAESNGIILTFIEVADFTDYETIICRKDHWREVFEIRFKKIESVRESLQRLYPIRLATMHARIVTKEDKLYLIAEVARLLSAIK